MKYSIDVLMPNTSQYNAIDHFTIKIFEALHRLGHRVRLLEGVDRFTKSQETSPDFTIGFNGALSTPDGEFWPDVIQVPHISCLLDPPFHFPGLERCSHLILTCDDRFVAKTFTGRMFPNVLFMPLACEKDLEPLSDQKKNYDVVVFATIFDFEAHQKKWKKDYPKSIYQVMNEAIQETLEDETTSFIKSFENAFNRMLSKAQNQGLFQVNFNEILSEIELYIKGLERVKMIQSIQDAKVHLFGAHEQQDSKNKYFKKQANVIVCNSVPFEETLQIMKRSKISFNSSMKNKEGPHDRIFSGLAAGALVVTNENPWLSEYFKDEESILFYRYRELDRLNNKVNAYLTDESKRQKVAERGRQIVMQHHTWDQRMATLLQQAGPIIDKFNAFR